MKRADRLLRVWRFSRARAHVAGTVLDIGCHDGTFLASFPAHRRLGVDVKIPSHAHAPWLLESSLTQMNLSERYQTITCLATYEHLAADERPSFWSVVQQHLTQEGQLVMTVPHRWVDEILRIGKALGVLSGMEDHQHSDVNETELIADAHRHQLRLERLERFQLGLNRLFVFRRCA
jgi:hypothetical protein